MKRNAILIATILLLIGGAASAKGGLGLWKILGGSGILEKAIEESATRNMLSTTATQDSTIATQKKLPNGEVVFWADQTTVIQYNSYRVVVSLTGKCDFNVWGEVTLGDQNKSFMIHAGETKANIDFENLDNGRKYNISVTVKN